MGSKCADYQLASLFKFVNKHQRLALPLSYFPLEALMSASPWEQLDIAYRTTLFKLGPLPQVKTTPLLWEEAVTVLIEQTNSFQSS